MSNFSIMSIGPNTVNSLMFAGINVCVSETKPCSRRLMFALSSGLINFLDKMDKITGYIMATQLLHLSAY